MADTQEQSVGDGSVAAQAKRDVVVIQGATAEQIAGMIAIFKDQIVAGLTLEAKRVVDDRVAEFKEELLKEMFEKQSGRAEAFGDPDFQHTLKEAQTAYARSGDEGLHDTLIGLIIERSKPTKRNRLTLTLNDAIAKAGHLTPEDFAAVTVIFYFKNVQHQMLMNVDGLADSIRRHVGPSVDTLPTDETSFSYMESVGVANTGISILQQGSIQQILTERYPCVLTLGAPRDALIALVPQTTQLILDKMIVESPFDSTRSVFALGDPKAAGAALSNFGVDAAAFEQSYTELCKANNISEEQFLKVMGQRIPFLQKLCRKYDKGPARNATLTSAGIALAHANLKRTAGLDADIGIWIKSATD